MQKLAQQIASQWLRNKKAGVEAQLDYLMRLQMLEGAFGLPEGTFSKNPRNIAKYDDMLGKPQYKEWLRKNSNSAYNTLLGSLRKRFRRNDLSGKDIEDFISEAASGLGSSLVRGKRMTYEVGKILSDKIQSGLVEPIAAFGGLLQNWVMKRIFSWVKQSKNKNFQENPSEDYNTDHDVTRQQEVSAQDLYEIVLGHLLKPKDATGRKVRELALNVWGKRRGCAIMVAWLDLVKEKGSSYHGIWTDAAEAIGIKPQGRASSMKRCMEMFVKELRKNPIFHKIEEDAETQQSFGAWNRRGSVVALDAETRALQRYFS